MGLEMFSSLDSSNLLTYQFHVHLPVPSFKGNGINVQIKLVNNPEIYVNQQQPLTNFKVIKKE